MQRIQSFFVFAISFVFAFFSFTTPVLAVDGGSGVDTTSDTVLEAQPAVEVIPPFDPNTLGDVAKQYMQSTHSETYALETILLFPSVPLYDNSGFEVRAKVQNKDKTKWNDVFMHIRSESKNEDGTSLSIDAWNANTTVASVELLTAFDWQKSAIEKIATEFVLAVGKSQMEETYNSLPSDVRKIRDLTKFTEDMKAHRFDLVESVHWDSAIPALPAGGGFKLRGDVCLRVPPTTPVASVEDAKFSCSSTQTKMPVYLHVKGDAELSPESRVECADPTKDLETCKTDPKLGTAIASWNMATKWSVLDYKSAESMKTRMDTDRVTEIDVILLVCMGGLVIGFLGLTGYYFIGLRGAPRELYLLYFSKIMEYSAYGAAASIMVPFLQNDVLMGDVKLGDSNGYLYYTVWTLASTVITIMVGAVCDTIGVKKTLVIGTVALLVSRFCMPLTQDVYWVTLLGFIPLAIGFAITGPVLKVGIKKFTTMKQSAMGFGLFYTLMNVGFAVGAEIADYYRDLSGDGGSTTVLGFNFTTYQAIIFVGFLLSIPSFLAVFVMRDGAEMTENGLVLQKKKATKQQTVDPVAEQQRLAQMRKELVYSLVATALSVALAYVMIQMEVHAWKLFKVVPAGKYVWAFMATILFFTITGVFYAIFSLLSTMHPAFDSIMRAVRKATEETVRQLKENFQEKPFWIYMAMLAILTFVRLTFYIFHLMFPTYAIRVFGGDFPVASIFGTLNPVMIIFLVPLISAITSNVKSYTMLLWGTALSSVSVFICFMPESISTALANTWFGTWVFDYWLEAPVGNQDPFVMSLVVFIMVFTVGEAIWSPRLMQFSAEIAPRGKEGAYIALAMLPYFFGKAGAGILSEQMTTRYFNDAQVLFPSHDTAWLWIGGMAAISPVGLLLFRGIFTKREKEAEAEAAAFLEEMKNQEAE